MKPGNPRGEYGICLVDDYLTFSSFIVSHCDRIRIPPPACLMGKKELYVYLVQERDRRVRELQAEMETRAARESLHSSPTPSLSHLSTAGSEHFSRSAPILSKCPYAPQQSQLIAVVAASRLYLCPVRSRPETTPCFPLEAVLTHLHIFSTGR